MNEPEIGNIEDLQPSAPEPVVSASPRSLVSWALLAVALLYGLSPLDFIPDTIPLAGWMDDIGLLFAAALNVFQKNSADQRAFLVQFAKYAKWVILLATLFVVAILGGLIALAVWIFGMFVGK